MLVQSRFADRFPMAHGQCHQLIVQTLTNSATRDAVGAAPAASEASDLTGRNVRATNAKDSAALGRNCDWLWYLMTDVTD